MKSRWGHEEVQVAWGPGPHALNHLCHLEGRVPESAASHPLTGPSDLPTCPLSPPRPCTFKTLRMLALPCLFLFGILLPWGLMGFCVPPATGGEGPSDPRCGLEAVGLGGTSLQVVTVHLKL